MTPCNEYEIRWIMMKNSLLQLTSLSCDLAAITDIKVLSIYNYIVDEKRKISLTNLRYLFGGSLAT